MEYRPYYLAREWKRLGHQPTIVANTVSHLRQVAPLGHGLAFREYIDHIPYIWLKGTSYSGNGVRRAINIFSFVVLLTSLSVRIAYSTRPKLVIASSTYPLDIIPARKIAQIAKAKLVFEVHDIWPLSPIELGGMSPSHPFIMLMQWAEDFAYRNADKVVSMLPNAAQHMIEHGMAPEKFVHIPNGICISEWQKPWDPVPKTHSRAIRAIRESKRFLLGYAGSHNISNALSTLLEASNLLKGENVCILMVGQGTEKDSLMSYARKLGCENVTFLPPVPKGSIPSLLSAMDALYIGWQKKSIYRFGINPNKLLDYMMAAKPIIHSIDAANDIVKHIRCGISVPAEDPEAIACAIKDIMLMDENERIAMGQRGRAYVMANHNYTTLATKFLDGIQ